MSFLSLDQLKMEQLNKKIHNDPVAFADLVLGIKLHQGQVKWVTNSQKRINILRPGNRWGKTLVAAVKHIWQGMCKPRLDGKVLTSEEWLRVEYNTLNFGPTYELGRGALLLARDLAQGNVLLPTGKTNQSMLKDWAITEDRSEASVLPSIKWATGASMLGRSMNEMGVAFKMRKLAFVTGDECADVPDLWTFTNNTLLMRVLDMDGNIDLVGTPQPEGTDYMRMIEMAEEDMKKPDYDNTGIFYTQRGSVYDNDFLPKNVIEEFERIADPMMREQILRGEYVETGEKYYGFERVQHAVDKDIKLLEYGYPNRKYVTAVDFAGGDSAWADFTVIETVDYTDEPYKLVGFKRFKGGDISIPAQYQLVDEMVKQFHSQLIIDSSALGGKNAQAFLGHLNPISQEFGPSKSSTLKMDMLATLKICLDGGQEPNYRRQKIQVNGEWVEKNPNWGLLRIPEIPVLINELQNYKLDDDKIRQDCVMCLAMIVFWLERRRPKLIRKAAVDFDFLGE